MVTAHDSDVVRVPIFMTPVSVSVILTVKELVPYNDAAIESWRQQQFAACGSEQLDVLEEEVRRATVVLRHPAEPRDAEHR